MGQGRGPRRGRQTQRLRKGHIYSSVVGGTSALHSNSKTCKSPVLKKYEPATGHGGHYAHGNHGRVGGAHCSGLPVLPLGHAGLWGRPVEPLKPGAIIDGHIGLAAEVGGQGNVAGSDTLPACGNEGLREVHLLGLEHGAEHLWALLEAVFRQEFHEWHVDRTLDVA